MELGETNKIYCIRILIRICNDLKINSDLDYFFQWIQIQINDSITIQWIKVVRFDLLDRAKAILERIGVDSQVALEQVEKREVIVFEKSKRNRFLIDFARQRGRIQKIQIDSN
mgnify:CR=1 FL=1